MKQHKVNFRRSAWMPKTLAACRTLGIEAKIRLGEGRFRRFCRAIVGSIAQKSGGICTVQADLQPISLKSDRLLAQAVVMALLLGGASAFAEPVATPTQNILSELLNRQQQMQTEMSELRDLVERQGYELDMLKRAQKETYMDTDQRIRALDALVRPTANAPVSTEVVPAPMPAPVEPAAPATQPAPVTQPVQTASADDQAKYDQGLKQLRAGQYQPAIKTFDQVIKANPPSPNRPNALYWTGEAYVVLGDLKSALNAFEKVVQENPSHQKAADAQLKVGYIYYDQKNYARAREILNKVKAKYPGTQAATLAEQRLKRMQSEGV